MQPTANDTRGAAIGHVVAAQGSFSKSAADQKELSLTAQLTARMNKIVEQPPASIR